MSRNDGPHIAGAIISLRTSTLPAGGQRGGDSALGYVSLRALWSVPEKVAATNRSLQSVCVSKFLTKKDAKHQTWPPPTPLCCSSGQNMGNFQKRSKTDLHPNSLIPLNSLSSRTGTSGSWLKPLAVPSLPVPSRLSFVSHWTRPGVYWC